MPTAPEQKSIRNGIELMLRWTTLIAFNQGRPMSAERQRNLTKAVQFIATAVREIYNHEGDDLRLTAFVLFESSMQDDEPVPLSQDRWWTPTAAAYHLFGLDDYKLEQPSEPLSGVGHSLTYYVDEYNAQVKRTTPRMNIDPLANDAWTLRQIIASGESGLGNERQSFQIGRERMRDVASALFRNVERLLGSVNAEELEEILRKWEVRSATALQSRRSTRSKEGHDETPKTRLPEIVAAGVHHPDYERLFDRRIILFTGTMGQQIVEVNTREWVHA